MILLMAIDVSILSQLVDRGDEWPLTLHLYTLMFVFLFCDS